MDNVNIETSFAGLRLKNPIIVSSSGLTSTVEKVVKLESKGAAAVVLKSIFEEQITLNVEFEMHRQMLEYTETYDYLNNFITSNSIEKYLQLIRDCKKQCSIPIIASINCYSKSRWTDFAIKAQEAGADAIEINVMLIDTNTEFKPGISEQLNLDIAAEVRKSVKIPVIMKLANRYSNIVALAEQLQHNDINGLVLFNRSFPTDINIMEMKFTHGSILSDKASFCETLRWTGIVAGIVPKMSLAASTGVHTYENMVKSILAGASAVEICSVIYKEGPDVIPYMLTKLADWMRDHAFKNIESFRGKMRFSSLNDENMYERSQFMKYFGGSDEYPPTKS